MNTNVGKYRNKAQCSFIKNNYTIEELLNCQRLPCGVPAPNDRYLINYYKFYLNQRLSQLPYLERKFCLAIKRNMWSKSTVFLQQQIPQPTNVDAVAAINNF